MLSFFAVGSNFNALCSNGSLCSILNDTNDLNSHKQFSLGVGFKSSLDMTSLQNSLFLDPFSSDNNTFDFNYGGGFDFIFKLNQYRFSSGVYFNKSEYTLSSNVMNSVHYNYQESFQVVSIPIGINYSFHASRTYYLGIGVDFEFYNNGSAVVSMNSTNPTHSYSEEFTLSYQPLILSPFIVLGKSFIGDLHALDIELRYQLIPMSRQQNYFVNPNESQTVSFEYYINLDYQYKYQCLSLILRLSRKIGSEACFIRC